MRLPSISGSLALFTTVTSLASYASATRTLYSTSLNPCSNSTGLTATLFDVSFFPDNATVYYKINAISTLSNKIVANVQVRAYGYLFYNSTIDPCSSAQLASLCHLTAGTIPIESNSQLPRSAVDIIPGIAYSFPDLDAQAKVIIYDKSTHAELACVVANLSNGQTVMQTGVQWAIAVVAGLALLASAVTSGLGHSNTAAHVAANTMSLFGFFQAQALVGMMAVQMPPVVQSWLQNYEWTMGIVRIGFMQTIMTWYQRATGGTPSTILSSLNVKSVEVQKRSLEIIGNGINSLLKRDTTTTSSENVVVYGITRVGFNAGIEQTNIFLTGLGFFVAFIVLVALGVAIFKVYCEFATKRGWMKTDTFEDFRNGWKIVLKGILFRIVLIGYTQMSVLCLWELTVRDSAAEVVLALFYFIAMTLCLSWAAFKVIRIAKRSVSMHKNPAYILYSDPAALNKWGFLYVQFRATAYYFIFPLLTYILVKCCFVAFAQESPVAQTVGLLIIEALWLIGVCILRPWMDKKTNAFNISIAVMNFINMIFLLVFTNVFNQPGLVSGVMGVIFWIANAVFALVLLILVLVASGYAIFHKNPDTRYQPMRDDRGSFIKSQTNLNTELDALAVTARGDMRMKRDLDSDSDSFATDSITRAQYEAKNTALPSSTNTSTRNVDTYGQPPHSPIDASAPFIPTNNGPRHGTPTSYNEGRNLTANSAYDNRPARSMNSASPTPQRMQNNGYQGYDRSQSLRSDNSTNYRPQQQQQQPQNAQAGGMWQRGAGYDH